MPIRAPDVVGSYFGGMQARQQQDYGNTRNALARMELENAPQEMQRRNRLADLQVQGAEQSLGADKAKIAYTTLKQALDSGDPRGFILQQVPQLAQQLQSRGIDLQSMDDQSVAQLTDQLARKYAGEAGIAPSSSAAPLSAQGKIGADVRAGYLTAEQGQSALNPGMTPYQKERLDIERKKLSQPSSKDERLVQIERNGQPVWVRESEAINQPAYVARDKPAAADLKYKREIAAKQPRLKAAVRRTERLANAVDAIAQNWIADGGPIDKYLLAWTEQGQEITQAKAQLLPELTALTRVPGIGSQSDLETRLSALQFPSSEFAPEVNARATEELRAFIRDLQDAYGNVDAELSTQEQGQKPQAQQQLQAPPAAIEYLRQNPQFKGAFRQKYGYLPDGI